MSCDIRVWYCRDGAVNSQSIYLYCNSPAYEDWVKGTWEDRTAIAAFKFGSNNYRFLFWGPRDSTPPCSDAQDLERARQLLLACDPQYVWPGAHLLLGLPSTQQCLPAPSTTAPHYTLAQDWWAKETAEDGGKRLGAEAMDAVRSILGGGRNT